MNERTIVAIENFAKAVSSILEVLEPDGSLKIKDLKEAQREMFDALSYEQLPDL